MDNDFRNRWRGLFDDDREKRRLEKKLFEEKKKEEQREESTVEKAQNIMSTLRGVREAMYGPESAKKNYLGLIIPLSIGAGLIGLLGFLGAFESKNKKNNFIEELTQEKGRIAYTIENTQNNKNIYIANLKNILSKRADKIYKTEGDIVSLAWSNNGKVLYSHETINNERDLIAKIELESDKRETFYNFKERKLNNKAVINSIWSSRNTDDLLYVKDTDKNWHTLNIKTKEIDKCQSELIGTETYPKGIALDQPTFCPDGRHYIDLDLNAICNNNGGRIDLDSDIKKCAWYKPFR